MVKITNIETYGWEAAIRGMRNPMNSWERSDSGFCVDLPSIVCTFECPYMKDACTGTDKEMRRNYVIGPNDLSLMLRLAKSGSDHAKYRRMITVTMDILAPLYWWKEFDTYKVGTVANSCSTMHTIAEKEFTRSDFSFDKIHPSFCGYWDVIDQYIGVLNNARLNYLDHDNLEKDFWWTMIQLLPTSYNQLRTVQLNYEVLAHIYHSRKEHKLDEWREFCKMIETLPYSQIITLKEEPNDKS